MTPAARHVRFRSLRFGNLELVACLAAAAAAAYVWAPRREAERAVEREVAALDATRRARWAVEEFRRRGLADRNADGVPEAGTAEELEKAGLLPPTPPGYGIDVLLPGRALREGRVALVGDAARADPVEAAKRFAVVTRPRSRAEALRSFYLDESGALYVAEGVVDAEERAHPPLPATTLAGAEDSTQEGPVWRRVEPRP